jgi:O-antigen ligase
MTVLTERRLPRWIDQRWFALFDLGCVAISLALWQALPRAGGWPVLLALLPWGLRLVGGRFPYRRTNGDLLLAIFLLTAIVSVWSAYDREVAWQKLWLIVGALLLFYALAAQPKENLWIIASVLGSIATLIALAFALTSDWIAKPSDLPFLTRIGHWLMAVRPELPVKLQPLHPNLVGGLLAILLPFALADAYHRRRIWRVNLSSALGFGWALLKIGLIAVGLFLTSSRGAWLALGAAFGCWQVWRGAGWLAGRFGWSQRVVTLFILAALGCLTLGWILLSPSGLVELANRLPGAPTVGSRITLARNSWHLLSDFPVIGGGLGSFPGLYSHYILDVPVFVFGYSHNFLLDLALELGSIGLIAVCAFYLSAAWILFINPVMDANQPLAWAACASLVVIFAHGLVDDVIYNQWGTPFLLFVPGMIYAVTQVTHEVETGDQTASQLIAELTQLRERKDSVAWAMSVVLVLILALAWIVHRPVLSIWYANLGAVEMARIELADFPSNRWDDGRNAAALTTVKDEFLSSLRFDSNNITANYRLGLIALERCDFPEAVSYLGTAHRSDPYHRGIQKNLGYAYTWIGQFETARGLLKEIPEAKQEMITFVWWWQTQHRPDLADNARDMTFRLLY